MLEPNRIQTNVFPLTILKLGDGTYYYNYDIKEILVEVANAEEERIETLWSCIQVHLIGIPEYKTCIRAIIREYISSEEEFALINKYNAYQMGIITDSSICLEYQEYCELIAIIKANVKKDFNINASNLDSELVPTTADMVNLLRTLITTTTLTDELALACKSLYPTWESLIDKELKIEDKVVYKGALYKITLDITVSKNLPPDITPFYKKITKASISYKSELDDNNDDVII